MGFTTRHWLIACVIFGTGFLCGSWIKQDRIARSTDSEVTIRVCHRPEGPESGVGIECYNTSYDTDWVITFTERAEYEKFLQEASEPWK